MFLPFEERLLHYALSSSFLQNFSKISNTLYLLVAIYLLFIWRREKENWVRLHYFLALATTVMLTFLIKHATQVLRPFEAVNLVVNASRYIGSSFPSAHTAIAFFCVSVIAQGLKGKRLVAYALYFWAVLISIGRFLAGLHYIIDLAAGLLLGYIVGRFSWKYEKEIVEFQKYLVHDLEGRRKSIHMVIGFLFALLVYFGPYREVVLFLLGLSITSLIFSILFKFRKLPDPISKIIHYLEREDEKEEFPVQGAFFFFLSSTIVAAAFQTKIAAAAITALALGDGLATIIGKRYGKRKHYHNMNKSLEGSLAGFLACVFGSMLFLNIQLSIINGIVFMVAESLHLEIGGKKINDNLYIPLVCALTLSLAQSL